MPGEVEIQALQSQTDWVKILALTTHCVTLEVSLNLSLHVKEEHNNPASQNWTNETICSFHNKFMSIYYVLDARE